MRISAKISCAALVFLAVNALCRTGLGSAETDELRKKLVETPGDTAILGELKDASSGITDVDEKARLLVIYELGCLYAGQFKEASITGDYLRKNLPSHPDIKYVSTAYTSDLCTNCQGTGFADLTCPKCGGSGACPLCKGSGTMIISHLQKGDEVVKCSPCGGTGKCRYCGGIGTTKIPCTQCGGKGCKFSRERTKTTYLSLLKGEEPPLLDEPETTNAPALTKPENK